MILRNRGEKLRIIFRIIFCSPGPSDLELIHDAGLRHVPVSGEQPCGHGLSAPPHRAGRAGSAAEPAHGLAHHKPHRSSHLGHAPAEQPRPHHQLQDLHQVLRPHQ